MKMEKLVIWEMFLSRITALTPLVSITSGRLLSVLLIIFLVASGVLVTTGNVAAGENEPVGANQQQQMPNNRQETKGSLFLKTLHKLVLNPPMTPEKISVAFGWAIRERVEDEKWRYAYFNSLFPNEPWRNSFFREKISDGKTRVYININKEFLCVSSDEVLAEFGDKYKGTIVFYSGPIPTLTEIVKSNYDKFLSGPLYEIDTPAKHMIGFSFHHSECLESVSVGHPEF